MENIKQHVQYIADRIENEGELSAYDYLQDALNIEYVVSSKGEYLGARVLVAFGNPTVWIDTLAGMVEGYWLGDRASVPFKDNLGLDEALSELWSSR
jgi:hypothetical protein